MRSNASTFRSFNYANDKMLAAVMPRLALVEMSATSEQPVTPVAPLRVTLAEASGTRLVGFRDVVVVQ